MYIQATHGPQQCIYRQRTGHNRQSIYRLRTGHNNVYTGYARATTDNLYTGYARATTDKVYTGYAQATTMYVQAMHGPQQCIYRLRTGHNRLNSNMSTSPECPCGMVQQTHAVHTWYNDVHQKKCVWLILRVYRDSCTTGWNNWRGQRPSSMWSGDSIDRR